MILNKSFKNLYIKLEWKYDGLPTSYSSSNQWKCRAVFRSRISRNLTSVTNNKVPSGTELAKIFCNEVDVREVKDLGVAARRYLKKKDPEDLIKILKDYFVLNSVPNTYDNIFKCPWRQVYTTNYDNAFEVGAQKHHILYESVDSTDIPRNSSNKKRVVHINGYINTVSTNNINTSFKLTNTSYLTEHFRNSSWSEVFKRDINSAHAVFFVGYSLYDIDIQEILFESPDLRDKTFFIERECISDEDIEELDLDSFGTILKKGIVKFSEDLGDVDELAINENELIVTSFDEPIYKNKDIDIQDAFIFNLLLNGDLNADLLYTDLISDKNKYCILRESFSEFMDEFNEKDNLLIHSGLANGKTVFAKQISMNFYNKGYKVFEINDDYLEKYAFNEVDEILKCYDKVLFLVENYTANMNVVSHINTSRRANTKIILVSRTYEHERVESEVYYSKKIIEISNTLEVSLDKLSPLDINNISEYFDLYGIWGEMYGENNKRKKQFLVDTANSEFHGILLGLLDSPQVKRKLNVFFEEMKDSSVLLLNIITILSLSMSNISNPNFHMVAALTNTNEIFNKSFRSGKVFRQLTTKNNDIVIAKSSVLAEFLLTNFPNPALLVDTLVSIAKNARAKSEGNRFYFSFYKDLASFRYIQKILPKKGKRESLIRFYQGLKEIPEERNNPHFWLQYAIARLSHPDEDNLAHAKSYLDNAMSLAEKKVNYWTDDIETQLARYYFESSIINNEQEVNLAFYDFEEGIKLIIKIYRNNNRPRKELFRPLKLVDNFYYKFKQQLNSYHINTIKSYLVLLNSFIVKEDIKYNSDIRFRMARDAIRDTLRDIGLTQHIADNS